MNNKPIKNDKNNYQYLTTNMMDYSSTDNKDRGEAAGEESCMLFSLLSTPVTGHRRGSLARYDGRIIIVRIHNVY